MDLFTSAEAMAAEARESNRVLKVVTNSGSTYLLSPVEGGREWMISRTGVEGRRSIEFGKVRGHVPSQGRDGLLIGTWETTGLRSVELL